MDPVYWGMIFEILLIGFIFWCYFGLQFAAKFPWETRLWKWFFGVD